MLLREGLKPSLFSVFAATFTRARLIVLLRHFVFGHRCANACVRRKSLSFVCWQMWRAAPFLGITYTSSNYRLSSSVLLSPRPYRFSPTFVLRLEIGRNVAFCFKKKISALRYIDSKGPGLKYTCEDAAGELPAAAPYAKKRCS